jgi:hypothetical protein
MDKKPLLSDLLREVAKFAPDYMIDEENDGNIIIILNMHLENSRLVPFEAEDEIDEAASGRD